MCRNELAFNGQVFVARISQDRIGEVYHKEDFQEDGDIEEGNPVPITDRDAEGAVIENEKERRKMMLNIILVLSKAQKDLVSNPGTLLINYLAFLNKWSVISQTKLQGQARLSGRRRHRGRKPRPNHRSRCRGCCYCNGQVFVARISQDRIGEVYHKVLAIIVKYVVRLRHVMTRSTRLVRPFVYYFNL
jgi:hypothetical protein